MRLRRRGGDCRGGVLLIDELSLVPAGVKYYVRGSLPCSWEHEEMGRQARVAFANLLQISKRSSHIH